MGNNCSCIVVEINKTTFYVCERIRAHRTSYTLLCTCENLSHAKRIVETMNIVEEQRDGKR
ncbi:hypothetical protein LCGC14_1105690 [marine sediment metagenome]|uniref:Uncharacterized protein n=1 Tax=marine sediment metagenome TaxID=412755 RepID=A0A0F9PRC0_9ZZZZ